MRSIFIACLVLAVNAASAFGQLEKKPQFSSRVAVVNIGVILDKYEKAREVKGDIQKILHAEKAYKPAQLDHPEDPQTVRAAKDKSAPKLSKKSSAKIIAVWKDIQGAIQRHADSQGMQLVVGYIDTTDKEKLDLFAEVNRKLGAMDDGGTVALYAAAPTDVTQAVLDLLAKKQPDKNEAKAVAKGTDRVAVVNVGLIFWRYDQAATFKRDLEADARPFNENAKKLQEDMAAWDRAIRKGGLDDDAVKELQTKIRNNKRELVDLANEMRTKLGKKSEDRLVLLWKNIRAGIKTYADQHDIELVLGYGDPLPWDLLDQFPNISRKKAALDYGHALPLYTHARLDISENVLLLLNDPKAAAEAAQDKMPTIKTGAVDVSHLFDKHVKSQQFKKELDAIRAPFAKREAKILEDIKTCQAAIAKEDFEAASEEEYETRIRKGKRELEDLFFDLRKAILKKEKAGLVPLWKEIQACNKGVAEAYDFGLILGHAGPKEKQSTDIADVRHKLQAMESGGVSLLYAHRSVELADAVARTLNHWAELSERRQSTQGTPDPKSILEEFDVFTDGDVLLVPVTINGKSYPFVVDTGDTGVVFDTSPGHVLGESLRTAIVMTTSDGVRKEIKAYRNPKAKLGRFVVGSAEEVYGADLSRFSAVLGHKVRGIIGMSFLKNHVVRLDTDKGKLYILKSADPDSGALRRIEPSPEPFAGDVPYLEGEVIGLGKEKFLIATAFGGYSGSIDDRSFAKLAKKGKLTLTGKVNTETFLAKEVFQSGRLAELRTADFSKQGLIFLEGEDNRLGLNYLLRFNVTFDFPNGKMYLIKSKRFGLPELQDMSGLRLARVGTETIVEIVDEGSPAASSGIKAGDVISSIESKAAGTLRLQEIRLMLCAEGSTIRVSTQRQGKDRTSSLALKDWRQKQK